MIWCLWKDQIWWDFRCKGSVIESIIQITRVQKCPLEMLQSSAPRDPATSNPPPKKEYNFHTPLLPPQASTSSTILALNSSRYNKIAVAAVYCEVKQRLVLKALKRCNYCSVENSSFENFLHTFIFVELLWFVAFSDGNHLTFSFHYISCLAFNKNERFGGF